MRGLMSYWACAQLETHRERTALHFLGLNGFTTYCPRILAQRPSRDGERSTWLFPGYAFVWIELQWHAARWALGVVRLVSSGPEPAKVPVKRDRRSQVARARRLRGAASAVGTQARR